jgi:hypothetical protein
MKTQLLLILSLTLISLISITDGCTSQSIAATNQTQSTNTGQLGTLPAGTPKVSLPTYPESPPKATEELRKTGGYSQVLRDTTVTTPINSDNVSRREPTSEDVDAFVARLAWNTYLPAEMFGIKALTEL